MSDNTTLNTGSGGDTIRTEDRTTFKTPVSLIDVGGTAGESLIGDSGVAMPVKGLGTAGTANSAVLTIQGIASMTPVQIGDNSSSITVDNAGTFAVQAACTNAGTFAVQVDGSALTALQLIDNVVLAEDDGHVSGDVGVMALAVRRDTPAVGSTTDGDYSTLNVDSSGRLYVNVNNSVTVAAHDVTNAGTFAVQAAQSGVWNITTCSTVTTVTGVTAITSSITPGTSAAHLGKAEDAAHSSGDTGVFMLAVRSDTAAATGQTDGDYTALVTDSSGRLHVNVGNTVTVASHAVTNAGTFAVQVDGSALTALQLIDDPVLSDDAAFTPGTSKVFAIGFQADETATDSVDEGDIGCPRMTLDRKIHVAAELETNSMRGSGTSLTPKYVIIDCATSGDNTILAAVASKKIRVLSCFLVASGAVNVRFESGASGTALTGQMNLTTNSGFVLPFNPVGWFETASNTLLNLELSGATSVDGSLTYVEV